MAKDTHNGRELNDNPTWIEWVAWSPAGLGFLWLVQKASWFWRHDADLQFGWLVLMLCAFLGWEAWPARPGVRFRCTWAVAGLAGAGLVFLLYAQIHAAVFGFIPAAVLSLAIGVFAVSGANCLFIYGLPGLRHFAFPIGFFLIALPIPSVIYAPIVGGLQGLVATIDVELLGLLGVPATQVGSLIHIPAGTVGINEACSGIRSLQSTVMATLFIGYLSLKSLSLRVLLLVACVLWAIIGNILRSLLLSLVANSRGIGSIQAYHDAAGWSILAFTVAGVVVVAWGLSRLEKLKPAARTSNIQHRTPNIELGPKRDKG